MIFGNQRCWEPLDRRPKASEAVLREADAEQAADRTIRTIPQILEMGNARHKALATDLRYVTIGRAWSAYHITGSHSGASAVLDSAPCRSFEGPTSCGRDAGWGRHDSP
jgi:hypothetical protein